MKKRLITIVIIVCLLVVMAVGMTACGAKNVQFLKAQIDALTSVKAGQSDMAIIDSTMAGYLINKQGSSFGDLSIIKIDDLKVDSEEYGVAAKKGNLALIDKVNEKLVEMQNNGTYGTIATKYGLSDRKVDMKYTSNGATDKSWQAILDKKEIVIAYTENAPMGIKEGDVVTGFDIELAEAIFKPLNIAVKTKLIEWASKELELNSDMVDLVWNGLTITDERKVNMAISIPYLTNEQAILVKTANKDLYKKKADLANIKIAIEKGSAAESVLKALGRIK